MPDPDLFDVSKLLVTLLHLAVAYVLALPIGWHQETSERTLGVRTFPLVSMASAAYVLLGLSVFPVDTEGQSRLIQGLMTGIGFLGAGAILKLHESVHGTATAASVWATGAIGAAAAYGHFEIAVLVSLATYATLRWVTPIKERIEKRADFKDE